MADALLLAWKYQKYKVSRLPRTGVYSSGRDPLAIGRKLGVERLWMEASTDGERVRVTVQLINLSDAHRCVKTFDEKSMNVLAFRIHSPKG